MDIEVTIFPGVQRNQYPNQALRGQRISITFKDLAKTCISYAFSPSLFQGNIRKKINFESSSIIGLDFDDGNLEVNVEKLNKLGVNYIIGTTRNHQKEKNGKKACDRYRVFLILDTKITNADMYEKILKRWLGTFPDADQNCSDSARYFFACEKILFEKYDGELLGFNKLPSIDESSPIDALFDWTLDNLHFYNDKPLAVSGVQFLNLAPTGLPGLWNRHLYLTALSANKNKWTQHEFIEVLSKLAPDKLDIKDLSTIKSAFKEKEFIGNGSDKKQSEIALEIVLEQAFMFETIDGDPYIFFKGLNHSYSYSIKSNAEKVSDIISDLYYEKSKKIISDKSIGETIRHLKMRSAKNTEKYVVNERIAIDGKRLIYSTGGEDGFIVIEAKEFNGSITFEKSVVTTLEGIYFSKSDEILPSPKLIKKLKRCYKEIINDFFNLINIPMYEDFLLCLAWMINALCIPSGDKPILNASGEQGCGKTTAVNFIHSLLDNRITILTNMPKDEREFYILAQDALILSFDNVSRISNQTSDVLCKISTGSTFVSRKLYNNSSKNVLKAKKSMIINGITSTPQQADALDRTININFEPIKEKISKSELERKFNELKDELFTAILELVAISILKFDSTSTSSDFRMTDFFKVGTILEGILEYPEGTFKEAYADSIRLNSANTIEGDPVGQGIVLAFQPGEIYNGSATQLFEKLKQALRSEDRLLNFPKNVNSFSKMLKRISPELGKHGFQIRLNRKSSLREISIKISKNCTVFDFKQDSLELDRDFFASSYEYNQNSQGYV